MNVSSSQMVSRAYAMRGTLSDLVIGRDKNDNDYAKGRLSFTTSGGKARSTTVLAFGRAYADSRESMVEGTVALFGTFRSGQFIVIGPVREKPVVEAEADVVSESVTESVSETVAETVADEGASAQDDVEPEAPARTKGPSTAMLAVIEKLKNNVPFAISDVRPNTLKALIERQLVSLLNGEDLVLTATGVDAWIKKFG